MDFLQIFTKTNKELRVRVFLYLPHQIYLIICICNYAILISFTSIEWININCLCKANFSTFTRNPMYWYSEYLSWYLNICSSIFIYLIFYIINFIEIFTSAQRSALGFTLLNIHSCNSKFFSSYSPFLISSLLSNKPLRRKWLFTPSFSYLIMFLIHNTCIYIKSLLLLIFFLKV